MKIKYVWEESDIKGGVRVKMPFKGAEECIIFYEYDDGTIYGLISLVDGNIFMRNCSPKDMAEKLNLDKYEPVTK